MGNLNDRYTYESDVHMIFIDTFMHAMSALVSCINIMEHLLMNGFGQTHSSYLASLRCLYLICSMQCKYSCYTIGVPILVKIMADVEVHPNV